MPISKMYLYGKGGHANVVQDALESQGIGVATSFDDDSTRASVDELGLRIRKDAFPELDHPLIITIGDNALRAAIAKQLTCEFGIGIHVSATVASTATIDKGTVVLQGAIVQANTVVGKHVLINTGASIDHDNVIGDFVHVSPQAVLCGQVTIGEGTHIGAAAVVIPNLKIGKWCTIGAGSVVINDIPDYCTAVGNPARVIKQKFPDIEPTTSTRLGHFDVVFVGSGLASTATVVNLVKNLEQSSSREPLRIGILESRPECFAGVAYGTAVGTKSLVITALNEFLPEPELSEFKAWLTANKGWAFDAFRNNPGERTTQWLEANSKAIADDNWDQLYLPRYLFGLFLKSIAEHVLNQASQNGLLCYELIQTTVMDIERIHDRFRLTFQRPNPDYTSVTANRVVLAIGSPPFRRLFNESIYSPRLGGLVIDNPYRKGFADVIEHIHQHLESHDCSRFNLLLIGSNATTIETIYNLCDHQTIIARMGNATILSPSCELPSRITPPSTNADLACNELSRLDQQPDLTAEQIYSAVKADIDSSKRQGLSFSDSFDAISNWVARLNSQLSFVERQKFVSHHGVEIGKLQRRAGGEYSDAVELLKNAGKLSFREGRFLEITENSGAGLRFDYLDHAGVRQRSNDIYQVIINCTGFETVSGDSSSVLIRNLLKRKLISVNSSSMGLNVDHQLTATKNLFVIGPLIAGNIIGEEMVWHAEHCGRIIRFAKLLSQQLVSASVIDANDSCVSSMPR